jgi:hypothetical protein
LLAADAKGARCLRQSLVVVVDEVDVGITSRIETLLFCKASLSVMGLIWRRIPVPIMSVAESFHS